MKGFGKGFTVRGFVFSVEGLGLRVFFLRVLGLGLRALGANHRRWFFLVLRVRALGFRTRDYNTYPKP